MHSWLEEGHEAIARPLLLQKPGSWSHRLETVFMGLSVGGNKDFPGFITKVFGTHVSSSWLKIDYDPGYGRAYDSCCNEHRLHDCCFSIKCNSYTIPGQ